jgi:hypothetical protein
MRPLRRLMAQMESAAGHAHVQAQTAHSSASPDGSMLELGRITSADLAAALQVSKSSARQHEARYRQFSEEFGQPGT